jgi:hypothetical protein
MFLKLDLFPSSGEGRETHTLLGLCESIFKIWMNIVRILDFRFSRRLTMKNVVYWDVTPCGSCKDRRFEGTYRFHHQGGKNRSVLRLVTVNVGPSSPILAPLWWRRYIPPKRRFLHESHDVTSHKTAFLTLSLFFYVHWITWQIVKMN